MKTVLKLLVTTAVILTAANASAVPTLGGAIKPGSAGITTITQQNAKSTVNFSDFDTTNNDTLTFHQPSSGSVVINAVLPANGGTVISNSAGVTFSGSSTVNVGSTTTLTTTVSPTTPTVFTPINTTAPALPAPVDPKTFTITKVTPSTPAPVKPVATVTKAPYLPLNPLPRPTLGYTATAIGLVSDSGKITIPSSLLREYR